MVTEKGSCMNLCTLHVLYSKEKDKHEPDLGQDNSRREDSKRADLALRRHALLQKSTSDQLGGTSQINRALKSQISHVFAV